MPPENPSGVVSPLAGSGAPRGLILVAFGCSGAAALAYEVAWARSLSLVLGSTTYAVSTMLATFMLGLALGGALGGRLADGGGSLILRFGLCEIGIGIAGIASVPLISQLPGLYLGLYRSLHLRPAAFFVGQALLCALVMLLPTILMGATFPIAARLLTPRLEEIGKSVGTAYTVNTTGAIFGSLAAGFVLVPGLGLRGTTLCAGALNVGVGLVLVLLAGGRRRWGGAAAALLVLPAASIPAASDPARGLANFYSAHRLLGSEPLGDLGSRQATELTVLSEKTTAEGTVRALRDRGGHLILQVGGKVEGTGPRDVANTLLLGYLPIAAHGAPQRALVIGLGAGVTLGAVKEHVPAVEVVEINPAVVDAVERFGPPGLLRDVEVSINDARNELLRAERTYDVITSEPSYPSESAVANLFTREFFAVAAERIGPTGVFCQWLPYYLLDDADVTLVLRTFVSVFPEAMLFKVPAGPDLILLGRRSPFSVSPEELRARVDRIAGKRAPLDFVLSRTTAQLARIAIDEPGELLRDDRPRLEFLVARHLLAADLRPAESSAEPAPP